MLGIKDAVEMTLHILKKLRVVWDGKQENEQFHYNMIQALIRVFRKAPNIVYQLSVRKLQG